MPLSPLQPFLLLLFTALSGLSTGLALIFSYPPHPSLPETPAAARSRNLLVLLLWAGGVILLVGAIRL